MTARDGHRPRGRTPRTDSSRPRGRGPRATASRPRVRAPHAATSRTRAHLPALLLAAFALAALVDLVSLAAGFSVGHAVAKPFLMPFLAAYAMASGAPRLLVAALLCGWGGDVLLLSDADPAFLAGMISFAAGHVCYLALFRAYGSPRARVAVLAPAYATALVVTVVALWPDLPAELRVPVAGYSVLLTAMACASAVRLGAVAGLGGALFLLSDTLIATGVADWPQLPRPDLWIMLTYVAAQFLLVSGALRALEARPGPMATYGEVRSTTP
ncbi:lysoplasmalogenase [Streptomyces sp. SID13726]|uniref:lysoplasmalogenase n=1 Tax=Streptomyces sp. SID13726 TaxID=2706058 RepID=UPI0013B7AA8A|nr:lysoplasmalogenase [Streptomyces sp. SID13726]NEB01305.1 lysoplasmalogenase [Streptomyces sp. SID13726]